jgi:hypothetical protein
MKIFAIAASLMLATTSIAFAQQAHPNIVTQMPDGQLIVAGKWLKPSQGPIDIPFMATFSEPPVVVVTSNWTAQVAYIDTVTRVDKDRFQVTSQNAANNYYVSWVAVGRK